MILKATSPPHWRFRIQSRAGSRQVSFEKAIGGNNMYRAMVCYRLIKGFDEKGKKPIPLEPKSNICQKYKKELSSRNL